MLQWHCLLCSRAIDCSSNSARVALSAVQYRDRLLFYRCYSGTVFFAVQRKIAVLLVLQSHCLVCSTVIDCDSTGATVALSAVQYSDRLLFYRRYNATDYCAVQRQISVLLLLHWRYLVCSTAIDCCSTSATVALSGVQCSFILLLYRC